MKYMDIYVTKAMDAYPYQLAETVEALNYALSADESNIYALCLMGRVYAEQMFNYMEAIRCYEEALGHDLDALIIYPYLIRALIANEDYDKARRLIEFAQSIKGIDRVDLLLNKIIIEEMTGHFTKALKMLKEMRKEVCNNRHNDWMEETEKRLKSKKGM
ncbi:MAG: hypothetical protein IPN73_08830 [Saprospiraceae bacterium]|nr:hypothetical protein [Saprospiraceae bacterium]